MVSFGTMVAPKPAEDVRVIAGFEREDVFEQFFYSDDLEADISYLLL